MSLTPFSAHAVAQFCERRSQPLSEYLAQSATLKQAVLTSPFRAFCPKRDGTNAIAGVESGR